MFFEEVSNPWVVRMMKIALTDAGVQIGSLFDTAGETYRVVGAVKAESGNVFVLTTTPGTIGLQQWSSASIRKITTPV